VIFGLFTRRAPIVVAAARPGDAAVLASIHRSGFERGWDASEFERMLAERSVLAHVARRGRSKPLGFALSRLAADEAEVLTVAVLPKARGGGVGTALMRTHLSRLAAAGVRRLFLEVADDNTAALSLYQAFGFEAVGRRPGYYARGAARASALIMRCKLA